MRALVFLLCWPGIALAAPDPAPTVVITIDAHAPTTPLPHFWEQLFGSGRAILTLREDWRRDLRDTVHATGMAYVRFHAIFHDEVGVYDEDAHGKPIYNFTYVDQIYDALLATGVRPFVELSFMPRKLASAPTEHEFWYRPIVAPPKDWDRWEALVQTLVQHLVDRYGIDEVSRWYFEVWNEPNIHFWVGQPKQATYFQLYDRAARAVKRVSARLRVGGPATAQAAWVDRFIEHAVAGKVPVDFVSTHVYANDTAEDVFGTHEKISRREMVCRAAKKVHDQVKASARPTLPIIWSEFNASWKNEPEITDSTMMGPWIADTIRRCDGLADIMAPWTFSDVFEEQGPAKEPFYGGYGAIAIDGLHKPMFNALALLHRLGSERIAIDADQSLFTRRADGTVVIALWNLALPDEKAAPRHLTLRWPDGAPKQAKLSRVDTTHGSLLATYQTMGRPRFPTPAQLVTLRKAAELPPPEGLAIRDTLSVDVPVNGLVLIEVR